jgi:hypothetical protein
MKKKDVAALVKRQVGREDETGSDDQQYDY